MLASTERAIVAYSEVREIVVERESIRRVSETSHPNGTRQEKACGGDSRASRNGENECRHRAHREGSAARGACACHCPHQRSCGQHGGKAGKRRSSALFSREHSWLISFIQEGSFRGTISHKFSICYVTQNERQLHEI